MRRINTISVIALLSTATSGSFGQAPTQWRVNLHLTYDSVANDWDTTSKRTTSNDFTEGDISFTTYNKHYAFEELKKSGIRTFYKTGSREDSITYIRVTHNPGYPSTEQLYYKKINDYDENGLLVHWQEYELNEEPSFGPTDFKNIYRNAQNKDTLVYYHEEDYNGFMCCNFNEETRTFYDAQDSIDSISVTRTGYSHSPASETHKYSYLTQNTKIISIYKDDDKIEEQIVDISYDEKGRVVERQEIYKDFLGYIDSTHTRIRYLDTNNQVAKIDSVFSTRYLIEDPNQNIKVNTIRHYTFHSGSYDLLYIWDNGQRNSEPLSEKYYTYDSIARLIEVRLDQDSMFFSKDRFFYSPETNSTLSMAKHLSIKVWPNPTKSSFIIQPLTAAQHLRIVDPFGRVVHSEKLSSPPIIEVDIDLKPGLYNITVYGENGYYQSGKVVVR